MSRDGGASREQMTEESLRSGWQEHGHGANIEEFCDWERRDRPKRKKMEGGRT